MNSTGEAGSAPRAPAHALQSVLRAARRRLAARRALEAAARTMPWSLAVAAALVATQRLLGARSPLDASAGPAAALALGIALGPPVASAALGALSARLPDVALALLVDRGLGLRERATTAVALRHAPDAGAWASRAIDAMGARGLAQALPWRPLPWRRSAALVALALAASALPPIPRRAAASEVPADPRVVAAAARLHEEADRLAEAMDEREAEPEARRLLEEVRRAAERAQARPMSADEAVRDLQRIDQQARTAQQRREAADAGALQRALSSIEQASLQRASAREASASEAASLEQQLQELAQRFAQDVPFEARESKRLAARLHEAAEALEASHPGLAGKLEQLASAIERGDAEAAARLARELAASPELKQLSSEAATAEALEEARRIVRQAMAAMGRAPTDAELAAESDREGDGEGQGPSGSSGPGAGSAGRDRSGRPAVATDWGVGTTLEAQPERAIGRQGLQQDRQSSETSDWREAYEALHESTRLEGARGRASRVQGSMGLGELVAVDSRQVARAPETASQPVVRVPASYARASEEALAREEIPGAYKDAVRKYFTSLDAPGGTTPAPAPASSEVP